MKKARDALFDEASWLRLERRAGTTLRASLERTLCDAIRSGALRAGSRLPSSRRLAALLGVSRGVASDAYAQLEAQGFVEMLPRRGPVVAAVPQPGRRSDRLAPADSRPPQFDLSATTPDVRLFPIRQWIGAYRHAGLQAPVRALDYGDPRGDSGLRETLCDRLGRTRGVIAEPHQLVIVQGVAQGLDLLLRLLARRGAQRVAVEDPSLDIQHDRIEDVGLQLIGRQVDQEGIQVDALAADAVLVTPAHQFPTGVVLSGERRRRLLAWARESTGLVIEDDYDADFRYDREPVRALQGLDPLRVAYLGTMSKTFAPALRLGWLVVPDEMVAEVTRMKRLLDFGSPAIDQLALRRLIEIGAYDRHLAHARTTYRRRRDRVVGALSSHLPDFPVRGVAAGLHVLVELPSGMNDQEVAREAARADLLVEPLSRSAVRRRDLSGLLIGYGRLHETAVDPAIRALGAVIHRMSGG